MQDALPSANLHLNPSIYCIFPGSQVSFIRWLTWMVVHTSSFPSFRIATPERGAAHILHRFQCNYRWGGKCCLVEAIGEIIDPQATQMLSEAESLHSHCVWVENKCIEAASQHLLRFTSLVEVLERPAAHKPMLQDPEVRPHKGQRGSHLMHTYLTSSISTDTTVVHTPLVVHTCIWSDYWWFQLLCSVL